MVYRLRISRRADKQLSKLDPHVSRIIATWLLKNVDGTDDPRRHGKGLTGPLSGRWRYSVGDYQILCAIEDDKLIVLAVEVGHRSAVYR